MSYKAYPKAHTRVFRLKGPLYGQRDAPYRWWETLSEWLVEQGFIQSKNDPCLYHRRAQIQMVSSTVLDEDKITALVGTGQTQSWFPFQ